MSEVVIELPVDLGDEAQAFGAYVSRFMERVSGEAERLSAFAEAPYFMMRSDPLGDRELKVITFQQSTPPTTSPRAGRSSAAGLEPPPFRRFAPIHLSRRPLGPSAV